MTLARGTSAGNGVLIGRHDPFRSMNEQTTLHLLAVVALTLRAHHGMTAIVDTAAPYATGPLPFGVRSPQRQSGKGGTVVRIKNGSGRLVVGDRFHDMNYGDWAFIPSGQSFCFEGRTISGMNFNAVTAQLR